MDYLEMDLILVQTHDQSLEVGVRPGVGVEAKVDVEVEVLSH